MRTATTTRAAQAPPTSSVTIRPEFRAICDLALKSLTAVPRNPVSAKPSELDELLFAVNISTSGDRRGAIAESLLLLMVFWPSRVYVARGTWGWISADYESISGGPVFTDDVGRVCSYGPSNFLWSTDPTALVGLLAKAWTGT